MNKCCQEIIKRVLRDLEKDIFLKERKDIPAGAPENWLKALSDTQVAYAKRKLKKYKQWIT